LTELFRQKHEEGEEIRHDIFLATLREKEALDQEPPELILVRDEKELVLCVATEYWTQIGGSQLYHDSYTYLIYSKDNIAEDVKAFLIEAGKTQDWNIDAKVRVSSGRCG
jgi:hypothetical protein